MKLKVLSIICCFALILSCAEKPQPDPDLLSAYSLLNKGNFSAAKLIIDQTPLKTESDTMLYYLLRGAVATCELDRSVNDSPEIERCISFYDDDDEKLAWAHVVMCFFLTNEGRHDEAVLETKKAEKLAMPLEADELKFLIYMQLFTNNLNNYNFDKYDEYMPKLNSYAVSDYDRAMLYYAMSFCCKIKGMDIDSAKMYAKQAVEYLENAPKVYNNIYVYYNYADLILDDDDTEAEKYIQKSLEIDTFRQVYSILGKINLKRGDIDKAKTFFKKSEEGSYWVEVEQDNNRALSEYYAAKGDHENALLYAKKSSAAKDTLIEYLSFDRSIAKIQEKYDLELENQKVTTELQRRTFIIILLSIIVLTAFLVMIFYQKYRLAQKRSEITEAHHTIDAYNQKISELTTDNQSADNKELEFLRQKVKALEAKFSSVYSTGRDLYAEVQKNSKIGRWSKDDYRNFIDYYRSVDFLFVRQLETDYVSLTDRQKVFLILVHIGKTKEQIMQIMTLEDGSYRSMKSRAENGKVQRGSDGVSS